MKQQLFRIAALMLLSAATLIGCNQQEQKTPPTIIGGKITLFAEVTAFSPVPVQGYGLVAGLEGTGSTQCPPQIRSYLRQYILAKLPSNSSLSPDQMLDSPNTAVVKISGVMPAAATKGEKFDLQITPVPGTKTTSLAGGRLYTANLMFAAGTKIVATAQGPVFLDTLGNPLPTAGYVLGGGSANESYDLALALYNPDFKMANSIRNRLSEQFGDSTIVTASRRHYSNKNSSAIYPTEIPICRTAQGTLSQRKPTARGVANRAIDQGFGRQCKKRRCRNIPRSHRKNTGSQNHSRALASTDPQSRFRAARCLLFIANDQGLGELRKITIDPASPYRLDAMEAIALGAKRNDAITILKTVPRRQ